ncbi:MAG: c-type cytochrome [Planctomycetes bacterium]|nr:c-type cytochrome [Planctomycetota bacterium]
MSRMPLACTCALALWTWLVSAAGSHGAEIPRAADAPRPHAPEASLELFQVDEGFRVELVASEPALADPVAMAFDARGRIFVCEIHGYNLEGHLDVVELNKTGVLDKAVRRIPANDRAIEEAKQDQYGTVKLLEDTDGDGRFDRSAVWADRLPACYGVVPAREGVIVFCAPDILYLADRDGDGTAEVREKLFTGFGLYDMWSRINNPRWAVDNWIYGASGIQSGGTIRGPHLPGEVRVGAVCFRFKPDGTALEPCSGKTSGYGQANDDWGNRFLCTNQQHALLIAPLAYRYLVRNPYYAAPNPVVNVSSYGHPAEVYPTSQPHPWRLARSKEPEWVQFYGVAEATANGYFTAASGQTIYRAAEFPAAYHGNHFSVDNAQNLVHRCLLERDGAGYVVRRANEEKVEFLTSTEQWFRPVNLTTGPDGALYIVDMYREIIEDYSAIPRYLQQQYGLIEGSKRGRIWRVKALDAPKPRKGDLASAPATRLVDELPNPNAWWRQTAQRLLIERADTTVADRLASMVRGGPTPQARLHALYTLDGLGALAPELVEHALSDPHYAIRMHALRLAERWLDARPALAQKVFEMTLDADPAVRLQLGFTLGQSTDLQAVDTLAKLGAGYGDDAWVRAAILSSVADTSDQLLNAILAPDGLTDRSRQLMRPLASIIGARRRDEEVANLLDTIVQAPDSQPQVDSLHGLLEGLKRHKPQALNSLAGQTALRRLLVNSSVDVRELAVQVAGLVQLQDSPEMKASYTRAIKTALDESQTLLDRQLAVSLLSGADYATLAPLVEELLDARQPLDLQVAAVAVLASTDDPRAGPLLLANWPTYTPKVQEAVLGAIFSRKNRLPSLLDAVEEGSVPRAGLDAVRRQQLTGNSDPQIRDRALSLLKSSGSQQGRNEVLAQFQAALTSPRDPQRGRQVYLDHCSKCHKLQEQGYAVGADLATASTRTDETILTDILDPSNRLTAGYQNYTVVTEDGRIFTGVLGAETATSITLKKEEGVEQTILRREIDEMEASSISMMPAELEKEVGPQDLADLLGYLREALGPAPPPGITLFDDEPSFADLLAEGEGAARPHTEAPFSGSTSLAITPPQRWNLRIPGWKYPIVEQPAAGEFRYLRFAWKSRKGRGVMIELAGDGKWPPADKPLWRYYSGQNTTEWQAVEVSADVPEDWVVVTRDLWQDFGSFTLTGIAPTAMGGEALFDSIELLRTLDGQTPGQ